MLLVLQNRKSSNYNQVDSGRIDTWDNIPEFAVPGSGICDVEAS